MRPASASLVIRPDLKDEELARAISDAWIDLQQANETAVVGGYPIGTRQF
jgi:hypothetical protein